MPIHWDGSISVGYKKIDQQHQEWANIFNRLESHLYTPSSDNAVQQQEVLHALLDLTSTHFRDEEAMFKQYKYPDLIRHRRIHKDFQQKIYNTYRQFLADELVLNSTILGMIRNWFVEHTSLEDKKAFAFIQDQAQGQTNSSTPLLEATDNQNQHQSADQE